jgi:hypothetical protein
MSSSPDNFDSVEKLVRLKRHEQPPPRYFKEFSGRVIDRIERGEARLSWWERFGFDLRPALAAGAGLVACGLIVYGVATTDGDAGAVGATGLIGFNPKDSAAPAPSLLAGPENSLVANSTNPVSTHGVTSDRNFYRASVMPAKFQVP